MRHDDWRKRIMMNGNGWSCEITTGKHIHRVQIKCLCFICEQSIVWIYEYEKEIVLEQQWV